MSRSCWSESTEEKTKNEKTEFVQLIDEDLSQIYCGMIFTYLYAFYISCVLYDSWQCRAFVTFVRIGVDYSYPKNSQKMGVILGKVS